MAKFTNTTYRTNGLLPNNNGNEQVAMFREEQQPTRRKLTHRKEVSLWHIINFFIHLNSTYIPDCGKTDKFITVF